MTNPRAVVSVPLRFKALVLLAGLSACKSEPPAPAETVATPVEAQEATLGTVVDRIRIHAEIRAAEHSKLASGSGGKVDAVLVREGDQVRPGQLLVKVAGALASAQLHQAEAQSEAARAQLQRVKALAEKNMASAASLEQAQTALAQAEAATEMARARYNDAMVRAPHAGIVAKVHISKGEQALPGATLVEVVDMSTVEVLAQIPERDVAFFEAGREATLTVDAYPGEVFKGEVRTVSVMANPYSRTFELEVVVNNPHGRLRQGMMARMEVVRQVVENVLVVRRDAVVEGLHERVVFLVENGLAKAAPVTLGPTDGTHVVITSGVQPGDKVVVLGQRSLVTGQPVRVVDKHGITQAPAPTDTTPRAAAADGAGGNKPVEEAAP